MIKEDRISYIAETIMNGLKGTTVMESIGILETIKYQLLQNTANDKLNTTWQNLKE